jgi:hypothetical protein
MNEEEFKRLCREGVVLIAPEAYGSPMSEDEMHEFLIYQEEEKKRLKLIEEDTQALIKAWGINNE